MSWGKSKSELPGPKELPTAVGREIVTKLGGNPDRIWHFKAVIHPREGRIDIFDVRVFDPSQASSQKISVKDYNSLTEHPDLILYEGWFSNRSEAEIKKTQ
jgi:hypothetical protein